MVSVIVANSKNMASGYFASTNTLIKCDQSGTKTSNQGYRKCIPAKMYSIFETNK